MRKLSVVLLILIILSTSTLPALAVETPSGVPFSEMEHEIDAIVAQHLNQSTPGVAVVVINDGNIIFSRGYGYADIERRIAIDPAITVFEYGSVNKVFVWIAVMQLVEQGLLDLDNDITIYLPNEFVFEKPFTMRDLMNHAAGFAMIPFDMIVDRIRIDESLKEALLRLQPVQIFEPGTVSAYSNYGTSLAAYVVEYISGQKYSLYEMENIIRPTGMVNTLNQPDWINNHAFLEHKAIGYIPNGRGGFAEGIWMHGPLYPAGALNGTAEDLARFAIALTPQPEAISPLFKCNDTWSSLFTPSTSDPSQLLGTYHGFMLFRSSPLTIGHGGNCPAFTAHVAVVPEERFGIVILSNAIDEVDILVDLYSLFFGDRSVITGVVQDDMPDATKLEGYYVSAIRFEGTLAEFFSYFGLLRLTAIDKNTIYIQMGAFQETYRQVEPYIFQLASSYALIAFLDETLHFRIEDGQVTHIMIGNGRDFTALPQGRTMPFLIGSAAIVVISFLFFLIMPTVMLICYLRKREKITPFKYFSNGFLLSGTLLILNQATLFIRVLVINLNRAVSEIAPHIWVNYGLLIISIGLLVASILTIKKDTEIRLRRKILFGLTILLHLLLILVLWDWNFFVIL